MLKCGGASGRANDPSPFTPDTQDMGGDPQIPDKGAVTTSTGTAELQDAFCELRELSPEKGNGTTTFNSHFPWEFRRGDVMGCEKHLGKQGERAL